MTLLIITVLSVGGGMAFLSQREARNETAREALFQARQALSAEQETLVKAAAEKLPKPKPDKADKDKAKPENDKLESDPRLEQAAMDLSNKKLDVDSTYLTAVPKLKAVMDAHPGTRAGFQATMLLGELYFQHGDFAKASGTFARALDHAPKSLDRLIASYALGFAQEGEAKFTEALTSFKTAERELASHPDFRFREEIWLAIARMTEKTGDQAGARAQYEKIRSEHPGSAAAKTAALYLSGLK